MRFKTVLRLAGVLLLLSVVGLIGAVRALDMARYKTFVMAEASKALGRPVSIDGALELRLGPIPRIIAHNVRLANPKGMSSPHLARIQKIEAEISLMQLIKREIRVNRLLIIGPDIFLERDRAGQGNWDFPGLKGSAGGMDVMPTRLALREVRVKNGAIAVTEGGRTARFNLAKLSVQPEAGPRDAFAIEAEADRDGDILIIGGRLGGGVPGKPWPIRLKATFRGWVALVEGGIGDPASLAGLDVRLNLQGSDVAEGLRQLDSSLPDGFLSRAPLRLTGRLVGALAQPGLDDLDLAFGRRDQLVLNGKGRIASVFDMSGLEMTLLAETDNLAALSGLAGVDLPALGPVKLSGQVNGGGPVWRFADLKGTLGGSDFGGDLVLHSGQPWRLDGKLNSHFLARSDVIASAHRGGERSATRTPSSDGLFFSSFAWPRPQGMGGTVAVTLSLGKVVLDPLTLTDVSLPLHLEGGARGTFRLGPFQALLQGGMIQGQAQITNDGAALSLRGVQVGGGGLLQSLGLDGVSGAPLDFAMDLNGPGDTARQWASGLKGRIQASMGKGNLKGAAIPWLGGDLASQFLGALNPLKSGAETTQLECAALGLDVAQGIAHAERSLVLQSDPVTILGSGRIDLRDESLDIRLSPRARDGFGLSLGGQVARITRLGGTLSQPSLALDEAGAAKTALSAGAAVASGGLSLLGELIYDKVTADPNPCQTALGQKAGSKPAKRR